jgi:LmbE family N-acetylglucosaminyl deacetylase
MLALLIKGLSVHGETRLPVNDRKESQGTKDLIFVAHEDDDLLFMNPDLMTRIRAGALIQTVYITAGDKDKGPDYWISRETGVKKAYAYMANVPNVWRKSTLEIGNKNIVKFTMAIQRLIADYYPDVIRYIYPGNHVDHQTVAKFVKLAEGKEKNRPTVIEYRDYDINKFPPNLVNFKSDEKWKVARIYGAHDRYFPKFIIEKKYQVYYNWCKREYLYNNPGIIRSK